MCKVCLTASNTNTVFGVNDVVLQIHWILSYLVSQVFGLPAPLYSPISFCLTRLQVPLSFTYPAFRLSLGQGHQVWREAFTKVQTVLYLMLSLLFLLYHPGQFIIQEGGGLWKALWYHFSRSLITVNAANIIFFSAAKTRTLFAQSIENVA